MIKLAAAFFISLAVSICTALLLIPYLKRLKAGQTIREDGPTWHSSKQGTPMMGGLIFIAGTIIACVFVGFNEITSGELSHIYVLLVGLIYALIGFLDDYTKLIKKRNLGLTAIQKLILQIIVAAGFVALMRLTGRMTTELYIPFFNVTVNLPEPLYSIFAVFVAVGTVNAVNITDGIDGLVTGVTIPVVICFTVIAAMWGSTSLSVLSTALTGALIAFLGFNFHPAKIFMGDTGSLFLGGIVFATAYALNTPLLLITLGIIYIIETLSDILQVAYFKLTKGKRIFKMAPFHHHLEMCGWSEYKLFAVFTAVSTVFAIITYIGVMNR